MKKHTLKKRIFSLLLTSAVMAGFTSTTVLAAEANAPPDKPEDGHTKELDLEQSNANEAAKIGLEDFEDGDSNAETSGQGAPDMEETETTVPEETTNTTETATPESEKDNSNAKDDQKIEETQTEASSAGSDLQTEKQPTDWFFRKATIEPQENQRATLQISFYGIEDYRQNGEDVFPSGGSKGNPYVVDTSQSNAGAGIVRFCQYISRGEGESFGNFPLRAVWEGHTFQYWYTRDADGNEVKINGSTMAGNDVQYVYAKWDTTEDTPITNQIQVEYYNWDPDNDEIEAKFIAAEEKEAGTPFGGILEEAQAERTNPPKEGYAFDTWATKIDGKECGVWDSAPGFGNVTIPDQGPMVVYAKWKYAPEEAYYKLSFDLNGAPDNAPGDFVGKTGEETTLPEVSWENHTFLGWYTEAEGGIRVGGSEDSYTMTKGNRTLYAHWEAKKDDVVTSYTVTFDPQGGNMPAGSDTKLSIKQGDGVGTLPVPTKENANFLGWFTEPENGEKREDDFVPTGNLTLYAHWEKKADVPVNPDGEKYELRFDLNYDGASPVPLIGTYASGDVVTEFPTKPERQYFEFLGWSLTKSGESGLIHQGDFKMPAAHTILFAQWKQQKAILYFDTQGGGNIDPWTCNLGANLSQNEQDASVLPVPQRDGYVFKGWFYDANNGNTDRPVTIQDVADKETVTIYAHWETANQDVTSYTVTFDPRGGNMPAGSDTKLSVNAGDSIGTLPLPAKENAIFLGWFTEPEGGEQRGDHFIPTGNLILYAHWDKIESNPSVDDNRPGKPDTHLPEEPTPPDNNNTTPEPPTNPPVEIEDPEVPLAPNPNMPDSSTNVVTPPSPSITIEEEDVPLANLPVTTIEDDEVPLSNVPIVVTIDDDMVPLAALPTTPKTGNESSLAAYAGLLSLSAVGLSGTIFFAVRKKKKG